MFRNIAKLLSLILFTFKIIGIDNDTLIENSFKKKKLKYDKILKSHHSCSRLGRFYPRLLRFLSTIEPNHNLFKAGFQLGFEANLQLNYLIYLRAKVENSDIDYDQTEKAFEQILDVIRNDCVKTEKVLLHELIDYFQKIKIESSIENKLFCIRVARLSLFLQQKKDKAFDELNKEILAKNEYLKLDRICCQT